MIHVIYHGGSPMSDRGDSGPASEGNVNDILVHETVVARGVPPEEGLWKTAAKPLFY